MKCFFLTRKYTFANRVKNMELDYVQHKITNLISIHKIVTIHYYELDKDFSFAGEAHNFWEMVYVDSGCVEIQAGSKLLHLKQGEITFHKPNEFHALKTDGKTAANVFVISFVCSSSAMKFFKGKVAVVPAKLRKHIANIIEEAEQSFDFMSVADVKLELKPDAPVGGQQMTRTHLEQFLILMIRQEQQSRNIRIFPTKESMENHLVSQMIQILEERVEEKIAVEQLCDDFNYSRAYLSRIFKASTGYTISEYVCRLKIRQAKRMIREGSCNFSQISDRLHFDNPHYFSRVFKRVTGMTPSEYKNSARAQRDKQAE